MDPRITSNELGMSNVFRLPEFPAKNYMVAVTDGPKPGIYFAAIEIEALVSMSNL